MGRRADLVVAADHVVEVDPVFADLVARVGPPDLRRGRPRREHFAELARAICYQQLAGKAAAAIHGRFDALFEDGPTPETVLSVPLTELRGAGLSGAKAASIRDLAEKVRDGTVELDRVGRLTDDQIVSELVQVRGIGRWTAEMFLMFQLGRLDVWPVGDYGVRKGFALVHGRPDHPAEKELQPLGEPYRPYRSVAAWYCWRAADTITL
ncbi:MAG TPA: DNA-3-methyladenine glycosylase 2 family protein [Acidimicrobiia bacterium]|nr:DNA-3-methyladenine glycosylase 2 family protein [Acidimicrobiia bacterium]